VRTSRPASPRRLVPTVADRTRSTVIASGHRLPSTRCRGTRGRRRTAAPAPHGYRPRPILAEWDDQVAQQSTADPEATHREGESHDLRIKLATKTRECADLRRRLDAATTAIAALHHGNTLLRQEVAHHRADVIPYPTRDLTHKHASTLSTHALPSIGGGSRSIRRNRADIPYQQKCGQVVVVSTPTSSRCQPAPDQAGHGDIRWSHDSCQDSLPLSRIARRARCSRNRQLCRWLSIA
jgi:hypothetical protein